ncbi:hypothetical protein RB595_003822 [Gaeumannomyces hyphopodioides]
MKLRNQAKNASRRKETTAQNQRHAVIKRFRKDPGVKAYTPRSISSVPDRASLEMNPIVEEQALARIHRLGQKSEVTTVRFFVRDTFEERALELQQSKKKLGELLIAPQAEAGTYDGLGSPEASRASKISVALSELSLNPGDRAVVGNKSVLPPWPGLLSSRRPTESRIAGRRKDGS